MDQALTLNMLNAEGRKVTIKQLQVSKGMKTLGVTLAPDGNNKDIVQALLEKASEWADLIQSGHPLLREEAWRALNSTILKGLEYPLLATTLTEEETEIIFSPIRQAALPKSGIVRTFPKAMTHAPLSHQGLGIPNVYTSQQVQHILTVLKHGGTNTITGNLITQSLELLKMEIGISRPLHDINFKKISHLATNSWVKNTWLFMEEHNLEINEEPQFMLLRERDAYLMDISYDSEVPTHFFPAINRCRLFRKILTLSDLFTGQGNKVRSYLWTPKHYLLHDDRTNWPLQGTPTKSDWNKWTKCLIGMLEIRAKDASMNPKYWLGNGSVTNTWK